MNNILCKKFEKSRLSSPPSVHVFIFLMGEKTTLLCSSGTGTVFCVFVDRIVDIGAFGYIVGACFTSLELYYITVLFILPDVISYVIIDWREDIN